MSMEPSINLLAEFDLRGNDLARYEIEKWRENGFPEGLYEHHTEEPTDGVHKDYLCLSLRYGYGKLHENTFFLRFAVVKKFITEFCQRHGVDEIKYSFVLDFS